MGAAVKAALAFIVKRVIPALIGAGVGVAVAYWFFQRGRADIKEINEQQERIIAQLTGKVNILEKEVSDMKKDIAELKKGKKIQQDQEEQLKSVQELYEKILHENQAEKEKVEKEVESFKKQLKDLEDRYKKDTAQYKQWKLEMNIQYGEVRLKLVEIAETAEKERAVIRELLNVTKSEFAGKRNEIAEKLKKSVARIEHLQTLLDELEEKFKKLPRTADANISKNACAVPKTYIHIKQKSAQLFRDNVPVREISIGVIDNILKTGMVQQIIFSAKCRQDIIGYVKSLAKEHKVPCEML